MQTHPPSHTPTRIHRLRTKKYIHIDTNTSAQIRYFSSRFHLKPGHEKKLVKTDDLRKYILHFLFLFLMESSAMSQERTDCFFCEKHHKEAISNENYIFTHHCWTPAAKLILSWITWINTNVSPQATCPFLQNRFTGIFNFWQNLFTTSPTNSTLIFTKCDA